VELVDNQMPKLFELSNNEISLPGIVKQALALARLIQDPLLCYSQLCNHDRLDILSLKLHPMQQQIINLSCSRKHEDTTELLRMLEIEFINVVNDVGVDLNRCDQFPHTSNCLQYVCGLGPHKAQHILKVLRQQRTNRINQIFSEKNRSPAAFNRLFLVTNCCLARRELINCSGFIKFDVNKIEKERIGNDQVEDIDLLDSTRIHPETYEWARKMVKDALDDNKDNDELDSVNSASSALRKIFKNPKPLFDLDLDAFAAELERINHGNKIITLYDILNELNKPYKNNRKQYQSMSDDEIFYCLTKESPKSFHVGKLVSCRVIEIACRRPTKKERLEAIHTKVNLKFELETDLKRLKFI